MPNKIQLFTEHSTTPIKILFDMESVENQASSQFSVNVADLPRGTYYLHVISGKIKEERIEKIRILLN